MIELRWLVYDGTEVVHEQPDGSTFSRKVEKRKLQFRQKVDTTVRAGIWSAEAQLQTANYQWTDWQDVPSVVGPDPSCP